MQKLLKKLTPQLKSIAKKLTPDRYLQEDLFQEMSLHLCQQWQDAPNHTVSWYTQSCRYHAQDYLKTGLSIDSKPRAGVEILPVWEQRSNGTLEPLPHSRQLKPKPRRQRQSVSSSPYEGEARRGRRTTALGQ